jgi:ZIP family zinc transporter
MSIDIELYSIILYSFCSGIMVFIGALLGKYFENHFHIKAIKSKVIHTSMAFGAGIMTSAVALVLVPKGVEDSSLVMMIFYFIFGVFIFSFIDNYLAKHKTHMAQLLAMLLDFIPEAIILGALFASNQSLAILMAIFIGLQNLPEAFNSYIELKESKHSKKKRLLVIFFLLSFVGVIASVLGYYFLSNNELIISALILIASGGLLYLIFNDIAPILKMKKSNLPIYGLSFGFLFGMIAEKVVS